MTILQTMLRSILILTETACLIGIFFFLNALRIAVSSYLRVPAVKMYEKIMSKDHAVHNKDIPKSAAIVLISSEDPAYYQHHGFYAAGMINAAKFNYKHHLRKVNRRGGSGITQQLVKNVYLSPEKTYTRKLAELLISIWIERKLTKQQILEMYLNVVYFGRGIYGIGQASRTFFSTEPVNLSVNQLITLVCILPNPDRYDPVKDQDLFRKAKASTIRKLLYFHCISEDYAAKLSIMPWNKDSGSDEITIFNSFLKKHPCWSENEGSSEYKYLRFHEEGPSGLMLHSVGCPVSEPFSFIKSWNRTNSTSPCVHAFIDANDGTIYQTLPWNFRGWHCGGEGNNTHLGIEMCESDHMRYEEGSEFMTDDLEKSVQNVGRAYAAAVKLFALLCKEYHLDESSVISHSEGHALGIASDHKDPEHLWRGLHTDLTMDGFRSDVRIMIEKGQINTLIGPPRKNKYPVLKRLKAFLSR